uniref:Uncharacterized protein n=1 Tax=viral metagenome TaxID=1070528 RepID=A0A6C0E0H6_9ZZZZ
MKQLKSCLIHYGYTTDTRYTTDCDTTFISIEPRKRCLDKILIHSNTVIKKCIVPNPVNHQIPFYTDIKEGNESYHIGEGFSGSKEYVFATTLQDLIIMYNIQNIEKLVININVSNLKDVLDSLVPINHIISHISFSECIDYNSYIDSNILCNFRRIDIGDIGYVNFAHKNLDIPLPKICMNSPSSSLINENHRLQLFIKQYNIDLIEFTPEKKKLFHLYILQHLENYFCKNSSHDLILIFNTDYLKTNFTYQILYPLAQDTLIVNKEYDIIYATKNCMYMLYQLLKSSQYSTYLSGKKLPAIFSKKYFYDYISSIFTVKFL